MASPLLASLDARIAAASDPLNAACLRAERAGLLARQGELAEARTEIGRLRAANDREPHAVVSAWLHLAEGLILHFTNESAAARDRLMRSLALSTAVQAREVQALSAAWLAHLDFAKLNFESMVRNVSIAIATASGESHQALARVSMVIAQSFHWTERLDLALPWYARVRLHATAERDEFMLSAHMHNMAWMTCAQARRLSVMGQENSTEVLNARGGAESTSRYDELVGTFSLIKFVPILHAQVLVLQNKYEEALYIYILNSDAAIQEGLGRLECTVLADRAWCRLHTGDKCGALKDANAALESITSETQVDDRAMTRTRVASIFQCLEYHDNASLQFTLADADWKEFKYLQSELVQMLNVALPMPHRII